MVYWICVFPILVSIHDTYHRHNWCNRKKGNSKRYANYNNLLRLVHQPRVHATSRQSAKSENAHQYALHVVMRTTLACCTSGLRAMQLLILSYFSNFPINMSRFIWFMGRIFQRFRTKISNHVLSIYDSHTYFLFSIDFIASSMIAPSESHYNLRLKQHWYIPESP